MIKMRDLLNENFNLSETAIDEIIESNIQPDQNPVEVKKNLVKLLTMINKLPNLITLFRVLNIDNSLGVNKDKLGTHFTLDLNFNDHFLNSIGLAGSDKKNLKIVKVNTLKSNIKIGRTLAQNVMFPNEKEIFIQPNSTFTNINILPYKGK